MLSAAETDHRQELLDDAQLALLYQNILDILEYLNNRPSIIPITHITDNINNFSSFDKILCIPLKTEQDEIANVMLGQLLNKSAFSTHSVITTSTYEEISSIIEKENLSTVFISIVYPSPIIAARKLCVYLQHKFPALKIILGLWGLNEINSELEERLKLSGVDTIIFSMENAISQMEKLRTSKPNISPT